MTSAILRTLFLSIQCLLGTAIASLTNAQQIRPQPGEQFDYTFINLINYPTRMANVSEFKGKLLILDFWNTGCLSCVASWPKLQALQEKFDSQIQILLVNALQDEATVRSAIETNKKKTGLDMTLPTVCGDTLLEGIFPYRAVPKLVWIDDAGRYRAFTSSSYVNETVIASILNGKRVKMHLFPFVEGRKSVNFNYDRSKLKSYRDPFFVNGNGIESDYMPLVTQSVLTGKIDGLMPVLYDIRDDSLHDRTTVILHGSLQSIYWVAFNPKNFSEKARMEDLLPLHGAFVEWNVQAEEFLPYKASGELNYDYHYAYQLTVPRTSRQRVQRIIQLDLAKYFGLNARMEKRKRECLVLSVIDTALIREKSRQQYPRESKIWRYSSVDELIKFLSYNASLYGKSPYPILDETNFDGPLSGFRVLTDPVAFNKELNACGLSLTIQEREIDILVVDQPDQYQFPEDMKFRMDSRTVEWNAPN